MRQVLAGITADWHIRRRDQIWARCPEIHGDGAYGLEQMVRISREQEWPILLVAGDVFEEKPQRSDAIALAAGVVRALTRTGALVYYVQGQHDLCDPPLLTSIAPDATHLHRCGLTYKGVRIVGLDYTSPREVEGALRSVEPGDVLVTHQVWKDCTGETRGEASLQHVLNHRLVVSGDYHASFEKSIVNGNGDPVRMISPGALCMQSLSEAVSHNVATLYDDLSVEWHPLRTRNVYVANVQTDDDLEKLLQDHVLTPVITLQDGVGPDVAKNIWRIRFNPRVKGVHRAITEAVAGRAYLFITPLVATDDTAHRASVPARTHEDALRAAAGGDVALFSAAKRIANAPNPREEYLAIYKEWLQ